MSQSPALRCLSVGVIVLCLLFTSQAQACWSISGSTGAPAVNGNCQCYSQFVWQPSQNKCVVNCALVTGSTNVSVSQTTCQCQPNLRFVRNSNNTWSCIPIDCTKVKFAVPSIPYSNNHCICISMWYWNSDVRDCVFDCSSVPNSLNISVGQTDCQCAPGYMWNASLQQCLPLQCSSISYTTGPDPSNPTDACLCQQLYQWDAVKTQCIIHCENDPNAIGVVGNSQCTCRTKYQWSGLNTNCSLNCLDPAIGFNVNTNAVNGQCTCINKYSWNSTQETCLINCRGLDNTTGVRVDDFTCQCKPNFFWSAAQYQCYINCSAISNTIVRTTNFDCRCKTNFTWVRVDTSCNPNCSNIKLTNLTATPVPGKCVCLNGYQWSVPTTTCILNCSIITNSDNQTAVNLTCGCASGYSWDNTTVKCVLNCSKYPNTVGNSVNGVCSCITNYGWINSTIGCMMQVCVIPFVYNAITHFCDLECCYIDFTTGMLDSQTCQCDRKHRWNNITNKCDLSCFLIDYILPEGTHTATTCECEPGYSWNSTSLECQQDCTFQYTYYNFTVKECCANCSRIQYAGLHPTICTKCICSFGSYWNPQSANCTSCQTVANADTTSYWSLDSCNCKRPYVWDRRQLKCVLSCSDIQKAISQEDDSSCRCIPGYKWSSATLTCKFDPASDQIRLPFHHRQTLPRPSFSSFP